ncbi:MAG: RnfH family protein [Halomonas sp.]|nr:RnfH family protein [Halomonas sp.]MBP5980744.1 RnfH family protein [Halomonas sp.]
MGDNSLPVEVAFALPAKQRLVALQVPHGTTARQAVTLANLPELFPELSEDTFSKAALGIFGKALRNPETQTLRAGDRVEVYRPLQIDPKAARLERAKRQASGQ